MRTSKNKIVFFTFLLLLNLTTILIFNLEISLKKLFQIHIFLVLLTISSYYLKKIITDQKTKKPIYFLIINFFRMSACIVFLLPTITSHEKLDTPYIYNFFIIYFIYLFFEIKTSFKIDEKINI